MIVDLHAHILPGLDNGCPTRLVAIRQLLHAQRAGIDVIAATSEYDPTTALPKDFLHRRDEAMEHLRLTLQPGMPRVVPGAEVLWCPGLEKLSALESLCIGAGSLLLRVQPGESIHAVAESIAALKTRLPGEVLLSNAETLAPEDAALLFSKGARCVLPLAALEHKAELKAFLPWFEQGHVAALGSAIRGEARAYRKLRKIARRLGEHYDAVMNTAVGIVSE